MTLDKRFRRFVHPICFASLLTAQACAAAPPPVAATRSSSAATTSIPIHVAPGAMPTAPAKEAHPETHPVAVDIAGLRRTLDTRISPDGRSIAYLLSIPSFDPKAKPSEQDSMGGWKIEKQIFIVDRSGGQPHMLTRHDNGVLAFRWAPDGKSIAFLRKHGGSIKIHVLPLDGGEAEIIDTGKLEPHQFEWSSRGDSFAFLAEEARNDAQKEADFRSGGVIDEATRHRPSTLFVVPRNGGQPKRVLSGSENVVAFVWSPDDKRFFVTASQTAEPYEASSELMGRIIEATNGALVAEVEAKPRVLNWIRWSPDGTKVSYARGDETFSLMNTIIVYDVAKKTPTNVTAGLDVTLNGFTWSGDSKRLSLFVAERTYTKILQVAATGGAPKDLGKTNRLISGEIGIPDKSGQFLAVVSSTTTETATPSIVELDKASVRVASQPNPHAASWTLGKTEIVKWKNAEGNEIEGVFVTSPHVPAGTPSPLVVMPHGGPDGVTQESFAGWPQYFAARGYSVLLPNYRGSLAYGKAFYTANRGRLGEIEYKDIESGVDSLIASGKVDAKRMYYGSWSWGGFLTAWTIANTKRYRAAMVGAGVTDVVAQYVTSDINHGGAALWEFTGNPWKNLDRFDQSNPMRILSRVTTPTLVAHGEEDARVPPMQGMLVYRALSDMGCEVKLLRYPREPHGFREPAHQAHLVANWAAWFDAH